MRGSTEKNKEILHGRPQLLEQNPDYEERCDAVVRMQTTLYKLMVKWPQGMFSEDDRYPVEGNEEKFREALEAGLLWENQRRLELLDWLIKEFEL